MRFDNDKAHNISKAVIYCRVSSKAQTKRGDGLKSQETRCREFARYRGYDVVQVFTDDLTGQRADRPGLTAMLSFLKKDRRNPHVVIIDDLTRFARNVRVHFELRQAIIMAGGILESPSVELRDDADGELHEYILASVSQHQSRKNAEQTLNRMRARCMNGYWVFQPPVGYKYEKRDGHGKMLVRNEPLASIVQEALEGYASGRFDTQVEVKRFLESQPDFPKDLPDGQIRNQRINDILTRVTYAGHIEVPNWDVPLRKAHHDGLISLATFQQIQDRLKGGARAPARKDINEDFPLRGFVTCGDCCKPLTACWSTSKTGKKHPYYLCYNRDCTSYRKSIPRDQVEGEFEALLHDLRPVPKLFDIVRTMFRTAWDARLAQAETMGVSLKREVARIEKQIEQLVDRIVDSESGTAIAAYERRIAALERDKLAADEKLANGLGPRRTFEEMFELAMAFLANPWKLWASDRLEDKRTVLKLTFAKRLPYDRKNGFRTPETTIPFNMLGGKNMGKCEMARPKGEHLSFYLNTLFPYCVAQSSVGFNGFSGRLSHLLASSCICGAGGRAPKRWRNLTMQTVTQFCARALGIADYPPPKPKRGPQFGAGARCWLCGGDTGGAGWPQAMAIAPTFTQHNTAKYADSDSVCQSCAALTRAETFQEMVKARGLDIKIWTQAGWHSYSHHIREDGHYETPSRDRTRGIILSPPSGAWVLTINATGQKHTIFRATVARSRSYFPVQMDEETVWVRHAEFVDCLAAFEAMCALGFSKDDILSGSYHPESMRRAGLSRWRPAEEAVRPWREASPALLALVHHAARSHKHFPPVEPIPVEKATPASIAGAAPTCGQLEMF